MEPEPGLSAEIGAVVGPEIGPGAGAEIGAGAEVGAGAGNGAEGDLKKIQTGRVTLCTATQVRGP